MVAARMWLTLGGSCRGGGDEVHGGGEDVAHVRGVLQGRGGRRAVD